MKRKIFLLALVPLVFISCSKQVSTALSAEQEVKIEKEVRAQLDEHLKSLSKLDYETWLGFISKDNFVPGFFSNVIGTFPDYESYVGAIKDSFARRVRQNYETLMVTVTALSPDLAIVTYTGLFENWFKSADYRRDYCNATVLWKKEKEGWKIIYVNEGWIPSDY